MINNKNRGDIKKKHESSSNILNNCNELIYNFVSLKEKDENDRINIDYNVELPKQKKQKLSTIFGIGENNPYKINEKIIGNDYLKYISPSITPGKVLCIIFYFN